MKVEKENQANAIWTRMLSGNKRFARGEAEHPWQDSTTRLDLIESQKPDAAVLACSDSRVPVEIIFDEGLGDIFTVRSAGAMLDQSTIESVEYAVETLDVDVLVVMTHQHCGALTAARKAYEAHDEAPTYIPFTIKQGMQTVEAADDGGIFDDLTEASTAEEIEQTQDDVERIHISMLIERLVNESNIVRKHLADETLKIVGARYVMNTGLVEVLSF